MNMSFFIAEQCVFTLHFWPSTQVVVHFVFTLVEGMVLRMRIDHFAHVIHIKHNIALIKFQIHDSRGATPWCWVMLQLNKWKVTCYTKYSNQSHIQLHHNPVIFKCRHTMILLFNFSFFLTWFPFVGLTPKKLRMDDSRWLFLHAFCLINFRMLLSVIWLEGGVVIDNIIRCAVPERRRLWRGCKMPHSCGHHKLQTPETYSIFPPQRPSMLAHTSSADYT